MTGSVDYTTGVVLAELDPAPGPLDSVFMRYQQDQKGDIIVGKNQVCKLNQIIYSSISYIGT